MKRIVILGDGMSDHPVAALGGKTPLMVANKPGMDRIAREGCTGLFQTIEQDMPAGSAVANLSVLGYDPQKTFQGRGVLEAASLGIIFNSSDLVMRVNLISIENGKILSHSSGHISNDESRQLIEDLNSHFQEESIQLYPGLSYRHILILPDGDSHIQCAPPHDHLGEDIESLWVKPLDMEAKPTADLLNRIINQSHGFLKTHPLNQKRMNDGKQPANMLWPWSQGKKPEMELFQERFRCQGAVISAVDLIKGLAILAGMDVIPVEGATGLYDTNYEGKADACIEALKDHDFVYVHVEAPDEAGHEKNLELKIRCIEDLDSRLVQRILNRIEADKIEAIVAVLPDHSTPISHGAHTRDLVPVAIWDPRKKPDSVTHFDEESVKSGSMGFLRKSEFMDAVFRD